jgi:hypothetical protein
VAMDLMLIGLMSLPNGIVFVQFHPVAYVSHNIRPVAHSLSNTRPHYKANIDTTDGQAQH